jgi:hypothetical protein
MNLFEKTLGRVGCSPLLTIVAEDDSVSLDLKPARSTKGSCVAVGDGKFDAANLCCDR